MKHISFLFFAALFAFAHVVASSCLSAGVLMLDFGPDPVVDSQRTNSPYHAVNSTFTGNYWNQVATQDLYDGLSYADGVESGLSVRLGRSSLSEDLSRRCLTFKGKPSSADLGNLMNRNAFGKGTAGRDAILFGSAHSEGALVGLSIEGLRSGDYEVYVVGANTNLSADDQASMGIGAFSGPEASMIDLSERLEVVDAVVENSSQGEWLPLINYAKINVRISPRNSVLYIYAVGMTAVEARGFLNLVQIVELH